MGAPVTPNPAKNRRVAFAAATVFCGMVGLSYASVPLYRVFCEQTGYGGTPRRADALSDKVTNQQITIRFDSNIDSGLAWKFAARQPKMTIKIGDAAMAYFDAKNIGDAVSTGTAKFNVTPPQAGAYFNKVQCFCFNKHTLKPGEAAEFPVQYFVDPAILDDPDAASIKEITLSYTFYPATPDAADVAATKTN
jgi:cytochrome c oxidase assembly protein subunit 11